MKRTSNVAPMIDELKGVRDSIDKLEEREEELAKQLKELLGDGTYDGIKYRATIKTTQSSRLDTKSMREALPDEMIEKFTKPGKPTTRITFAGKDV